MHGLELIHVKREASQIPKLQVFPMGFPGYLRVKNS